MSIFKIPQPRGLARKQPMAKGFIALISVIILSVVLLVAVLSLSKFGIANRFLLLDLERKSASEALAQACVEVALIAIANDPLTNKSYTQVPVGAGECAIKSIQPGAPGFRVVEATASSTGATTNLRVVVTAAAATIYSVQEVPTW